MTSGGDLELVALVRAGDRTAFDALAARHQPWVYRVCRRFLRSDDAARDAAQDVFARAFERLDTCRGDNFAGWLKAIAVNVCLNVIDREKRWGKVAPADDLASPAPPADRQLADAEQSRRVRQVIAGLPPKQRIVFVMKYIDECSYEEIERLTGFSANEVKSYVQNARRNFVNQWRREAVTEEAAWRRTT
jgi:RNA polymerase sigma-70 factor (ECF subfamily)